jgi:TIR domain
LPQPHGIFISYRRDQAEAHAGRIYDRLCEVFGEKAVFMDVDSISPGFDFPQALDDAVKSCDVMLVLIGPGWAEVRDEKGRRLDDPNDYVRQEVEAGLRREIPVIPVLFGGAAPPRPDELPEGLQSLVRRQAFSLPHETFRSQAQVLVDLLQPLVAGGAQEAQSELEPTWTVEAISKTSSLRVLRVRLTHAQHLVTYDVGAFSATLSVDDVVVTRKFWPTGKEEGAPTVEVPFQLIDGDAVRQCTFAAYYGTWTIERATLAVDGQVLYDEGEQ